MEEILITCTNNLTAFTDAIRGVIPKTITQRCMVGQKIRYRCKCVAGKIRQKCCTGLKDIHPATKSEVVDHAFQHLESEWCQDTAMPSLRGKITGLS